MLDAVNNTASNNYQSSQSQGVLGKDDFLKLMLAQIKYQDPLNPMDGTAYSAQLAQFSSLEQLTNLNSSVKQSVDANYVLTQSINNTLSANLIGKEVKIGSQHLVNNGDNSVNIGYTLPENAKSVTINILDQYGNVVRTFDEKNIEKGSSKLSWDFTDNDGNKLINGVYTMQISATNFNDQALTVNPYITGIIDGIRFTESGTLMIVDASEYSVADIIEVLNPGGGN
jgi:flagellar basal-body rod modification protein FlgD